jgi:hypothetical protein
MKTKLFLVILTLASYLITGCVKDEVFVGDTNTDSDIALVINEVMSNQGDSNPDWIEIFNPSESEIDMSGFGVYDKPDAIYKFAAGTKIAAKGYVVIICDKVLATSDSATYANFGISSEGETIFLVDTAAAIVDEVNVPAMPLGISYARIPDGGDVFENANGTKGAPNSNTNEPPVIEADTLVTGMINDNERFQYDIIVKDASGIASVKLWLQTATETFYFDMAPMGAGSYRLLLPLMEQGVILYYIEAVDVTGLKTFFKPEKAAAFSLTVIDGLAVFKSVKLSTENPAAFEDIIITVDAADASGVAGVKLYYLVNSEVEGDKVSVELTYSNGVWSDTIPGQDNDAVIRYYLRATDNTGLNSYYPLEEKDGSGAIIGDFNHDDAATWPQITVAPFVMQLVLNEICGKQTVDDDWIEIYNTTDGEIDLNGYTIVKTDDAGAESVIYTATVETKIASHGYFVITTLPVAGETVLTGGISNTKNLKLELKNSANVVQSTFEKSDATTSLTGGHPTDGSYARIPNGTGDWTIQTVYTKGAANN